VAALFVINAAAYANIVPRLPGIKAELGLSNAALGAAVAAVPLGSLLSGLAAGPLIQRWGSARVATACGLGFALVVPAVSLAGSWLALAATFAVFGLFDSVMDVSMNAHALRVQRAYGRSIVSALHGLWSLGAVAGAGAASLVVGAGVGLRPHLLGAGLVLGALTVAARRHLLPGPDDTEREDLEAGKSAADLAGVGDAGSSGAGPALVSGSDDEEVAGTRAPGRAATLAVLGLVLLLAGAIEDSPASWGAVLLREELGTSAGVGGLVFVAFQSAMTAGRLLADRVVDRLGPVTVLRAGSVLVAVGAGLGLLAGTPAAVVAGFAVAGLGAAPLFPVVFHAAGNLPGLATGHGVAVVAWASRLGFLVVPPLVGLVADAASVRTGLAVVPAAGVALLGLVGVVGVAEAPDDPR
jgi:MFS family permease